MATGSRSTLPHPTSSFVGRAVEIGDVTRLLTAGHRLVTLTGPGGSGKSRLAIEAASRVTERYTDGVFWVGLSVLRDARQLRATVAVALGTTDDLASHIGDRRLLLLLDNFEQIVEAAPDVVHVLQACPNLSALVTSRELLRVAGEIEYAVPALAPADAVELFCARANKAADPATVELCERLDNLPLALELAAARTGVLSPRQILARLPERLDLFRGSRGGEPRQQTLRAAIEWSCRLLTSDELALFARLAVFEGGCGIDAAERVAAADVDLLQSLVDKSLLRHNHERFWMLETIREYAVELLHASNESEDVRSRHLAWCIDFLQGAERLLLRGDTDLAQAMGEEFGNIRAAISWSISTGRIESALQLVRPRLFWQSVQTHIAEGCEWIETLLLRADGVAPELRARVLMTAGDLRRIAGDLDGARLALEEALELLQHHQDESAVGEAAYSLARVEMSVGAYDRADELTRAGLAAARAAADAQVDAELSSQHAEIEYRLGRVAAAETTVAQVLEKARGVGDVHTESEALRVQAMIDRDRGNFQVARSLAQRSLSLSRQLSDAYCVSIALGVLGTVELQDGLPQVARTAFAEALDLQKTLAQWSRALDSLWGVAAAVLSAGELERAALLLGAEAGLRKESGSPFQVSTAEHRNTVMQALQVRVPGPALASWWRRGESLSRHESVQLALAADDASPEPAAELVATVPAVARREGEYWTVEFNGHRFRLRDTKGVHYLSVLLHSPGREFYALDLSSEGAEASTRGAPTADLTAVRPVGTTGAGPMLDAQAKASYRARLRELEEERAEATSWSDVGRVERVTDEIDFLTRELTTAMGLGGRDRGASSDAERARVNITRAIRSTMQRVRECDGALADHLAATVHTGMYCSYTPDPRAPIDWSDP